MKNAVQIITETGLRVYKELTPMKKDQVDLQNAVVWIPDSKTPNAPPKYLLLRWPSKLFVARWPSRGRVRSCFRAI